MMKTAKLKNGFSVKLFALLAAAIIFFAAAPGKAFAMQIVVQQFDDEYITLEVEPTDRVEDVKAKIYDKLRIPVVSQVLIFAGKELSDGNTLQDYSVQKDSILRLLMRIGSVSPIIEGLKDGEEYYGDVTFTVSSDRSPLKQVTVDGVAAEAENGKYTLKADNAAHTVKAVNEGGAAVECSVTVYKKYAVAYYVDGETFFTEQVGYGKDASMPPVPEKEGHTGRWSAEGKNITADTEIHAAYTPNVYTITFMGEGGRMRSCGRAVWRKHSLSTGAGKNRIYRQMGPGY